MMKLNYSEIEILSSIEMEVNTTKEFHDFFPSVKASQGYTKVIDDNEDGVFKIWNHRVGREEQESDLDNIILHFNSTSVHGGHGNRKLATFGEVVREIESTPTIEQDYRTASYANYVSKLMGEQKKKDENKEDEYIYFSFVDNIKIKVITYLIAHLQNPIVCDKLENKLLLIQGNY